MLPLRRNSLRPTPSASGRVIRPGHHRPLGTTWRTRMLWADAEGTPELGDVAFETLDGGTIDDVQRAYEVVGVEEPARGKRWVLFLERLDFASAIGLSLERPWWTFVRDRA